MDRRIRVVLVDDQRLFIEGLLVVIETQAPDLKVVGVAYNGIDALELVAAELPDVVLMDVRMPGLDGVKAVQILHQRHPTVRILMLTTFDDDDYVYRAIDNGAVGYLLKDVPSVQLIGAIRAASTGNVQISPSIAVKLIHKAFPWNMDGERERSGTDVSSRGDLGLSKREEEILSLVARGLDNREIAARLNIAEQTVKNRVSDLYFLMDVHDRLHLIRIAQHLGYPKQ